MAEEIIVEKVGNIGKINFNRDRRMNALTPEMVEEMVEALSGFGKDSQVRVVVFSGNGRAFSSGGDMEFLESLFDKEPFQIKKEVYATFGGAIKTLKLFPKPTIAAVNGPAMGAGCEITLACDFRIASEKAVFCESWIGLGVIPPLGGMFLLPRLVGLTKATEMILLGTRVDGTEAARIGLANKVVPHERLEEEAMGLAEKLAKGPRLAYEVAKEGLRRGMESTLAAEWEFNMYAQSMLLDSQDFAEAVQAFVEKREPVFQGR